MNRPPRRTDAKLNYSQHAQMVRDVNRLNGLQFDPSVFSVISDQTGMFVSLVMSEVATYPTSFAVKEVNGSSITIYGGSITVGLAPEYTVGDTVLPITSSAYVGWEFTIASKTLAIVNFGSTFINDDDHIRQKLYHVKYNGPDSIEIDRDCSREISFPANWGSY